ncbi:MAG: hypothetical protein OHK0019_00870 [Saprospiraceae bacterium]
MGQQQTVALMGNVEELAAKQAALLLAALRDLAKTEPPMTLSEAVAWLNEGCEQGKTRISESHLRALVARKAVPFTNAALPGATRIMPLFWKHELAEWDGAR